MTLEEKTDAAKGKLQQLLSAIASGKTLLVCTYTRATRIRQYDVDKFAKVGIPLLKAKGPSLYMARGRHFDCIDYCGLHLE